MAVSTHGGKHRAIIDRQDGIIKIGTKFKFLSFLPFWKPSTLNIYIPENYSKNLNITTISGNVKFDGKSIDKTIKLNKLRLNADSGNIALKNLDINRLDNEETSGKLNADNLTTKTASMDVKSGNIHLSRFTGELNGKVLSGRLNAHFKKLNEPVDLDVKSGSVSLKFPKNADFYPQRTHKAERLLSIKLVIKEANLFEAVNWIWCSPYRHYHTFRGYWSRPPCRSFNLCSSRHIFS